MPVDAASANTTRNFDPLPHPPLFLRATVHFPPARCVHSDRLPPRQSPLPTHRQAVCRISPRDCIRYTDSGWHPRHTYRQNHGSRYRETTAVHPIHGEGFPSAVPSGAHPPHRERNRKRYHRSAATSRLPLHSPVVVTATPPRNCPARRSYRLILFSRFSPLLSSICWY